MDNNLCINSFEGKYDNKDVIKKHIELISNCFYKNMVEYCKQGMKCVNDNENTNPTFFMTKIQELQDGIESENIDSIIISIDSIQKIKFNYKDNSRGNNNFTIIFFLDENTKYGNYVFFEKLKQHYKSLSKNNSKNNSDSGNSSVFNPLRKMFGFINPIPKIGQEPTKDFVDIKDITARPYPNTKVKIKFEDNPEKQATVIRDDGDTSEIPQNIMVRYENNETEKFTKSSNIKIKICNIPEHYRGGKRSRTIKKTNKKKTSKKHRRKTTKNKK